MEDKNQLVNSGKEHSGDVAVESPRPAHEQGLAAHDLIYCESHYEYISLVSPIRADWLHKPEDLEGSDGVT